MNLAKDFGPNYKAGFVKKDGRQLLRTSIALLAYHQRRLTVQDTYGVLVCRPGGGSRRRPPGTSRTALTG